MRQPRSIALRLALWLSLGTGLLWLGAAAISTLVLRHELQEAFDETLSQSAIRLLPLALRDLHEPTGRNDPIAAVIDSDEAAFTYLVHDSTGKVIIRASDAPQTIASVPMADGYLELSGKRAYALSDPGSGFGIVVIEMSSHRQEALGEAAGALFWPLAGLLPLIAATIWLSVRSGMRPLVAFSRDVSTRNSTNLAPLDVAGQPAELAPIAREVAALLARLKSAMEAERNFAANSAHELRTPIAGALAQTQRLALDLGDHPAARRVADVERALRHLSQLSEKLLQLARLEAGFARSEVLVDLRPVIELVVRDFEVASATAGRVQLEAEAGADLHARINADAFAIALRNVIHNGLVHGATDGPVIVTARGGPIVTVRNHGPVVPPDVLAKLGERFIRGDTSASGTGLGLAIVSAIMTQSNAHVELLSPAPGFTDGFAVTMDLTIAPG